MPPPCQVLKWARLNGCPWDKWTPAQAAQAGHLNVLTWAHERGCPWDQHSCAGAAEGGHLKVFKYLREEVTFPPSYLREEYRGKGSRNTRSCFAFVDFVCLA